MVKITQLPPQQIPKQITAYTRVKTMRDRVLAFLNANNKNGFEIKTKIERIPNKIIKRIRWARMAGINTSEIQHLENPQPNQNYKISIPYTTSVLNSYTEGIQMLHQNIVKACLVTESLSFNNKELLNDEYLVRKEMFLKEHEFRKHLIGTKVNFSFMISE